MISLSDAVRLESNNLAVNSFKPWWEVAIDYTLNAFLLVVLFALAGVTISGTPGLVCLPTDTKLTSFNYATNNYVNAKCTTHVDGHVLIIFPYIIFIQWLLLFVLHLSWFNLPALKAFLSSTFDSFTVFKQVEKSRPRVNKKGKKPEKMTEQDKNIVPKPNGLVKDNDNGSGEDNEELTSETGRNARLVYIVDWLQYLLQFKYNLVNIYAAKTLATCALTALFAIGIISWLLFYRWKTAFQCDLNGVLPPPYNLNECSFAAAPYVYSIMILNVIFAILLFIFNIRALFWLAKFRYIFSRYLKTWNGKHKHPLKDKPGFYDYYFCVKLFKANSSEGVLVCEAMEAAFKVFGDKAPEETTSAHDFALVVPKDPHYSKDQFISTEILRELGMVHKKSVDSCDDLWAALANSLDESAPALMHTDLTGVEHEIREKVVQELLAKHMLFKDLINKDDHCPVFEDYLEDIKKDEPRENGIIEDHYILMAFASLYHLNVVVIRPQKSSLLYEPKHPEENQSVRFITFVPPWYYYASSVDPDTPAEKKDAALNFVTDQATQTALVKKINELWESKGYDKYKRTLENILPQELPYKLPELEETEVATTGGVGLRFRKQKKTTRKVEHFSLMPMDTV